MTHELGQREQTAAPGPQVTTEHGTSRGMYVVCVIQTVLLAMAFAFALFDVTAPGAADAAPFDETALRWILYLALGWAGVGAGLIHTVFARKIAKGIGWKTSGFQYEVGFADLAIGLAAVYAANRDAPTAWVAASIAGGTFLLLAALNHIRGMITERNFAPGNSLIVISDLGIPVSLFVLLLTTNAI